ncbi:phage adaptor protein [Azospirillum sp. ST 5-10]|uniref:phage adaptor protein n=1 Tax=unclassified Azospirillum TaxID=2630922 RepID=UPI003F49C95B
MALGTYGELKASVADWLNRSDLTTQIPDFIRLFEVEAGKVLRLREMVKRATASISNEYELPPDDFLEAVSFRINGDGGGSLELLGEVQFDQLRATWATGRPRAFAVIGQQLAFYPAPGGASYTGELAYYSAIPALSDSVTTNWLLAAAPNAYLFGSLEAAAPLLDEDERVPTWGALKVRALQALIDADNRAKRGGGTMRMRSRVRW